MDRHQQNEVLAQEGITHIYWHGYVSYVGLRNGTPVSGIVCYDNKLIKTIRPMNSKDYQYMAKWVKWKDNMFSSQERAAEKQGARDEDACVRASDSKTQDELRKENGALHFPMQK